MATRGVGDLVMPSIELPALPWFVSTVPTAASVRFGTETPPP